MQFYSFSWWQNMSKIIVFFIWIQSNWLPLLRRYSLAQKIFFVCVCVSASLVYKFRRIIWSCTTMLHLIPSSYPVSASTNWGNKHGQCLISYRLSDNIDSLYLKEKLWKDGNCRMTNVKQRAARGKAVKLDVVSKVLKNICQGQNTKLARWLHLLFLILGLYNHSSCFWPS